jgi:hypothetical protein
LLKNNALELFLINGRTYLIAFETQNERYNYRQYRPTTAVANTISNTVTRDAVCDEILKMELPNRVDYESEVGGGMLKMSITKKWKMGLISNFEYLMHLNTLAGNKSPISFANTRDKGVPSTISLSTQYSLLF